jgi:Lrp/AsnC family leucine-responsive transcriptional regulator
MINEIDRQILTILQEDARVSNAEIARRLGMAPSAIFERIKKLEKKEIILGYQAQICPIAMGSSLLAYIFIHTDEPVGTSIVGGELAAIPEVQEVHHIAGEDCYMVKVRAANTEDLWEILKERVGPIKDIQTRTTIVLETLKESSQIQLEERSLNGSN